MFKFKQINLINCIFYQLIFIQTLLFSFYTNAENNSKLNKIVIPLNDWASQRVLSKSIGQLYENLGFDVSYQDIKVKNQWGALKRGLIHMQIEVWEPSMGEVFNEYVEKQYILDMGSHKAKVREEWWYPQYVENLCPGLPHWQALNKCAHIFSQAGSQNKGVYYSGPWFYNDADIIRALNLNFVIKELPDDKALIAHLKNSAKMMNPILLLNWSPNWTDTRLKGKFIEFPGFSPECETVPEWGLNTKHVKDCGNKKNAWLKKAAWPGLATYNQCAFDLLKNINLNSKMISEASALVVVDRLTEAQAAVAWLNMFQQQVNTWMQGVCSDSRK